LLAVLLIWPTSMARLYMKSPDKIGDSKLSESLRDVIVLTNYGVDVRYPGDFPNVTSSDAQQAIRMAEKVRRLVLELL